MESYDAEIAPNAQEWLELDEMERNLLIEDYHRAVRAPVPRDARKMHAIMHTVVENQLAMNIEPTVRALARLMREGLDRHEAVHAVGGLIAAQIFELLKQEEPAEVINERYRAEMERYSVAQWRKDFG